MKGTHHCGPELGLRVCWRSGAREQISGTHLDAAEGMATTPTRYQAELWLLPNGGAVTGEALVHALPPVFVVQCSKLGNQYKVLEPPLQNVATRVSESKTGVEVAMEGWHEWEWTPSVSRDKTCQSLRFLPC